MTVLPKAETHCDHHSTNIADGMCCRNSCQSEKTVHLTAKLRCNIKAVVIKVLYGGFCFQGTHGDQPLGTGEVVECNDGSNAVFLTAADHLTVVLHFGFVELSLNRFDSGPLDGKPVAV